MGFARLGNLSFRIDPIQIAYTYQIDYVTIDTLGGQVVQVLGATTSDITITGLFGQDHANKKESWELAENFHLAIRGLMDNQVIPPGKGKVAVHQPITFTYMDGVHNWDMQVLIKSIQDSSGDGSLEHASGKFSYGYTLTLFLVQDSSELLSRVSKDDFIQRISRGVGWKGLTSFQGSLTAQDAIAFIQNASPSNPTFNGYLEGLFEKTAGA